MSVPDSKMKFGVFLAPFHSPRRDPTADLHRDMRMVEHLDRIGFDEVFIGEHHSGGWEIIGSPEIFIAMAAARTKQIHFGTGVVSLGYHHPLLLADRMVLLDHLTRGRVTMGIGPGALPSDSAMMGIPYDDIRGRMEESLDAIYALLTTEEPVTRKTSWFEITEGRLNLRPYSSPCFEITVAATISPSGPRLAGRYGLPILSLAATAPGGFEVLSEHWRIVCEQAQEHNRPVPNRSDWRLVGPMHIAETRAEAERQAAGYIDEFATYFFRNPLGRYQKDIKGQEIADDASALEKIRKLGIGVVGTPQDAIEQIERLQESTGGFGCFQLLAGDWANEENTLRSLTLFAEEVAPHFTKSAQRRGEWWEYFWEARGDIGKVFAEALQNANRRYADERAASDPPPS